MLNTEHNNEKEKKKTLLNAQHRVDSFAKHLRDIGKFSSSPHVSSAAAKYFSADGQSPDGNLACGICLCPGPYAAQKQKGCRVCFEAWSLVLSGLAGATWELRPARRHAAALQTEPW